MQTVPPALALMAGMLAQDVPEADNAHYRQYQPQQMQLGFPHPDCIVESSSLAAVRTPKIYSDFTALKVQLAPRPPSPPACVIP